MTQFIAVDEAGHVLYACGRPDPVDFIGATPLPPDGDGATYHPWQSPVLFSDNPSTTAILTWDGAAVGWLEPDQTLDAARQRQWALIKLARDQALSGGFTYDGSLFDSDAVSIGRITGAAMLAMMAAAAGEPYSVAWVLADNSERSLDDAEMMAAGVAAGAHVQRIVGSGQSLRKLLDAAKSIEQVGAVTWPAEAT